MKTYRFIAYFKGVDYMSEDMAEALYEAGCDDCLPGSSDGEAYAYFDREAERFEEAVASVIANVKTAGYEVQRVQINESDLAELTTE